VTYTVRASPSNAILKTMWPNFVVHAFRRFASVTAQSFANEKPQVVGYDWFSDQEVAAYDRACAVDGTGRIDDATWRDLDVRAYLRLVGAQCSIFGRQMLFHRLRAGRNPQDQANASLHTLGDPATDLALANTLKTRRQLRCVDTEIAQTLFHGALVSAPQWTARLWMAPYLGIGALALMGLWPGAATAWLAIAYFAFVAFVQVKLYRQLTRWKAQRDAVLAMLDAARAFGNCGRTTPHAVLGPLGASLPDIQKLITALSPTWVERTPMLAEYANLFALHEYASFGTRIQCLQDRFAALRTVYEQLAECEAQLCLMEHLKTCSVVCWVQPAGPRDLRLVDMVNPLVGDAQPLSIDLHGKGAFISGQNGVGKSTFLRGLGLNLLAARAFGFCYAKEAELPLLPVWSSIQNEDSLDTADSLYMAEMRRCETLLAVAERPTGAVFILDEIFRGTNHVESVSAAAAVINQLASRALLVVSSHHLVLAPLLHPKLEALRMVSDPLSTGSLRLEPGLLLETNGIHMMERYAIPEQVRATAIQVHDWLAGYMTRPDHFPELL